MLRLRTDSALKSRVRNIGPIGTGTAAAAATGIEAVADDGAAGAGRVPRGHRGVGFQA